MSDKPPECIVCDAPLTNADDILCPRCKRKAARQTMRLRADEVDHKTGMIWGRSDA